MIYRYAKPEAIAIWSDQRKYSIMLEIELLACEAMEEIKEIPDGIAAACRLGSKCLLPDKFPVERIIEIENTTKHDVIAFLTMINETIGESARYLHKGMTSSDVLDTAFAIQLKESGELILNSSPHNSCTSLSSLANSQPISFSSDLKYSLFILMPSSSIFLKIGARLLSN